jgi:hypothetical protein
LTNIRITKHRILHGEYLNYWTKEGNISKFSCINVNLVSSSNSLNQRSLEFECPAQHGQTPRLPIDMIYSTKYGPVAVCSGKVGENNVISLYSEKVAGKANTPIMNFNFKTNLGNGADQEIISLLNTDNESLLRFVRLDNYQDLEKDVIIYKERGSSIYYHNLELKLAFSNATISREIINVKVVKSRFLIVEVQETTTKDNIDTYLFDMEADDRNSTHVLGKYGGCFLKNKDNKPENFSTNFTMDCSSHFHQKNMRFLNSHTLPENPSNFFFEFKPASYNTANGTNSTGRIDVYMCQRSNSTQCELVIKSWPEMSTERATRYSSGNYFLQISNYNLNDTNVEFEFFMSTKRYKAFPRSVFKLNFSVPKDTLDNFSYYFDEVSEVAFITGSNFSSSFRVDPVMFKIRFIEFNSSTIDEYTSQQDVNEKVVKTLLDDNLIQVNKSWIQFELKFEDRLTKSFSNITHTLAYNNRTTLGEYMFWPHFKGQVSRDPPAQVGKSIPADIHVITDSIPMGLSKSLDVSDLFRGSFIKLKTDVSNKSRSYQEISNSYLDPFVYKFNVKKPKYLEDFYLVDTEKGEKRKVYLIVSTKTDTNIYTGNRFPTNTEETLSPTYTMRDFRELTTYYPINLTHGLAQVQEVIYTLSPFDDMNMTEVSSKGVNGVCHNSTLMFHDKLGPLHFCIHDLKTFYKRLIDDSNIESLTMTTEVQNVLKSMNKIRFLKSSESYINQIFMFYTRNSEALKDTNYKDYTMFMAILRIDHKADPRLVLVSNYMLPFGEKFDTNANLYALEIAGNRAIFLERSNVEKGEHRIGIMSVDRGLEPFILNYLPLPSKLLVEATTRFILTDVSDETDIDHNQNSVMSIESKSYQICFKVMMADTKEIKVVVFNPQAPIFSALSIIELPPEFKVLDSGPFFIISKDKRKTSLALLAAKTPRLDEEFMSKETEMIIFMVTDMTPTLQFKPFTETKYVIKPMPSTNIWKDNLEQVYNFNVTSNILSEEKINENKFKNPTDRDMIDTVKKKFKVTYELWGNKYDSIQNNTKNVTKAISVEIKSNDYIKSIEGLKDKDQLQDLHAFFIRIDPMKHIVGHIFNYSGQAESSIEDFMGIVKILSPNLTTPITINDTNTEVLRNISDKQLGKINLDSSCPNSVYEQVTTFISDKVTTLNKVRRCKAQGFLHFITSWESKLLKVRNDQLNHFTSRFTKYETNTGYVLHQQYLFYFQRTQGTGGGAVVTICRQDIGLLDRDNSDLIGCTQANSGTQSYSFENNVMNTFLSLEVTPLNEAGSNDADRYIITVYHYNKPMSIYTLVEFYDMSFTKDPKDDKKELAFLTSLGSIYVGSNNLKVAVSAISSEKNASSNARTVQVHIGLIYYRWRQTTELTLMQDVIELNYTKNYANGSLETSGKSETKENSLQGFTVPPGGSGKLMKFATLLFSMKDPSTVLRQVVEKMRLWIPQKPLSPRFEDSFDDNQKVPIFKIVVEFPNSNSYLLHSNIRLLQQIYVEYEKNSSLYNKTLGGVEVLLSKFKIAPIENPFIGFLPNAENPDPVFMDDYFFIINNYQDKSYFYFYTLEPANLKSYPDLGKPNYRNIFGIDLAAEGNSMKSLYTIDEEDKSSYMRTNLLIPLEEKPVSMTVIPNCNPDSHLEHCLMYLTTEERLRSVNFTSFVNVRVKSHKVASRNVTVNVTGKYGKTRQLTLLMLGDKDVSFWRESYNLTIILVLLGVSLGLTIATMIVVRKDVQITLDENNQVLSRHSVIPITGLIMNFLENRVLPQDDKDKEELSVSSEDSDEEGQELKQKLVAPPIEPRKTVVMLVEPTHELKDQEDEKAKELRSGQNYIVDPNEQNSDDDYANPLR